MSKIDRNRGAIIRKHPDGFRVVMYNDTPGAYFYENGSKCETAVAEEAGFNVRIDSRNLARQKLRANYEKQIAAKFANVEARVDALMQHDPDVLDNLRVTRMPDQTFMIVDEDDNPLIDMKLSQEEAVAIFAGITGRDWIQSAEDPPAIMNPYLEMKSRGIRALLKSAEVEVPKGLTMPELATFALESLGLPESEESEKESEDDKDPEKKADANSDLE